MSFEHFVLMGFFGGVANDLVDFINQRKKDQKFTPDTLVYLARLILGAIVGYLIFATGLPNNLTAFGLAYLGIDGIEIFLERIGFKRSGGSSDEQLG